MISSSISSCGSNDSARARSSRRRNGSGTSRTCSPRSRPSRSMSESCWRTAPTSARVRRRFSRTVRSGARAGSWYTGARPRASASLGRRNVDLLAVHGDRAGVGPQDPGEDLDQRRLAGSVRAEQGVHLARPHRQIDGAQRDDRPERLAHGSGLQQRVVHSSINEPRSSAGTGTGPGQCGLRCGGRPTCSAARSSTRDGGCSRGKVLLPPSKRHSPGPLQSKSCWGS